MAENLDLLMSELLPFLAPQKFKSKDLEMSKKSYPPTASVSKWLQTWTC